MSETPSYHFIERDIIHSASDPRRCVPQQVLAGSTVLDIGCGIGQTLSAAEFSNCSARHRIDIDAEVNEVGKSLFSDLKHQVASAENLPLADNTFDFTLSRVPLPYTNFPLTLREFRRVKKPGGRVWLVLQSWKMERRNIANGLRDLNARRMNVRHIECI